MRILLTGGSGFVGKNVIEQLGEKHELVAPTHKELELVDQEAMDAYFKSKKTRGNWSSDKTEMMVFKLLQKAGSRWKRLRKHGEVLKVMSGVIYEDGIEKAA